MFSRTGELSQLERQIDRAIRELDNHPVGSEDYVRTLDVVTKLHKMKEEEKPSSLSRDTMAIVGANLIGIIMIIKHEHVNVITSRALNLILRSRI